MHEPEKTESERNIRLQNENRDLDRNNHRLKSRVQTLNDELKPLKSQLKTQSGLAWERKTEIDRLKSDIYHLTLEHRELVKEKLQLAHMQEMTSNMYEQVEQEKARLMSEYNEEKARLRGEINMLRNMLRNRARSLPLRP